MTALAADRNTQSREGNMRQYGVKAATQIYKGGLVALDSNGYLVMASDAANIKVVGVADENVLGTTNLAKKCRVVSGRSFRFNATSITNAMVGKIMFVVDDNTFDDTTGTNGVKAGRLVARESDTEGWIFIPNGGASGLGVVTADGSDAATTQALANALKAYLNTYVE